jgi:Protein of unknown function (DUF2490)
VLIAAVRRFGVVTLLALSAAVPRSASAQSTDAPESIANEYRVTLVATKPAAEREKVVFFGYLGVVDSPDKQVSSLYYSPPGLIIKPKPWTEIWVGMFGIYNSNKSTDNSWELRPLTGLKLYAPNHAHINLYNFTRFEYRSVHQSGSTTSTPRLRNRIGVEVPFTQARAWAPKTWYGLSDVEYFYRLNDQYLERYRVRAGLGRVLSKTWRAEFIYHAEFTGGNGVHKAYTNNIWRLNIKLSLPRRGQRVSVAPDFDE